MLYLSYKTYDDVNAGGASGTLDDSTAQTSGTQEPKRLWETVQEDPVDVYWRGQDGKIPRKRDTRFCKHGDKGMCDYCMPLEVSVAEHRETRIPLNSKFFSHMILGITRNMPLSICRSMPTFASYNLPRVPLEPHLQQLDYHLYNPNHTK